MSEIRAIRKIVTGKQTVDGAGVKLVRVIGRHEYQGRTGPGVQRD